MFQAGLILEGGAERGVFTAGALDYLMEEEIWFSYVCGVSAGACNAVDYDDYARVCSANTGLVWRSYSRWELEGRSIPDDDLVRLRAGQNRNFQIIADVEFAPFLDLSSYFDVTVPSVSDRLKRGADLVVCDGAQLIGGPNCGLLFGSKDALEKIKTTPAHYLCHVDRATLAVLAKTLELYDDPETALATIPALRALAASIANLESRAKRLAAILETYESVEQAKVVEGRSALCANASFGAFPTRIVELRPRFVSPAEMALSLEKKSPRLLVRWTRDAVLIDPRTFPAEQDVVVAELFEKQERGASPANPTNNDSSRP